MAAKIVVMKDNQPVQEFVLEKESTVVGRQKECDISIADPSVSGVHARILQRDGKYQIKDMSSTNGVHVKGKRIERHTLKSGDIVVVGEHQLKFVEGLFAARGALKGEKKAATKAATPPPARVTPQIDEPQTDTSQAEPDDIDAHLLILTGKNKYQRIELTEQLTSIGVPGIQMAAVSQRRQGHYIVHVDGGKEANRVPQVNGEPIGFNSRRLEHGDRIEVADIEMRYVLSDVTVIGVT
jgi:pSer/pThr/pTyr-binding forkhead associated (FHA) protein